MFKASFKSICEGTVKISRQRGEGHIVLECDGTYCRFDDSDALKLAEVLIRAVRRVEG